MTVPGIASAAPDIPGAPVIDIVDTDASYSTNSLYQYLMKQQGEGILFGHQHTTDNGITFSEANGVNSDVLAATGEYPGIFGWDTLILEGLERPGTGSLANGEENARKWAEGMINAHELGGINTISAHMKNFVTDENFNDTSGRVVSQILPGGPENAEFNEYLDLIALTADLTVDGDGDPIPLIFRPFHENTGSWFWWGAAHATAGEYKEIFRYTVEYLRDTKGVSNMLYAFSPNGSFGGDAERYLATYPGDDWVDVLGYDSYDYDNSLADSDAYIESVRVDLGMVTDLAAERGKVPAFTEFGRNGERTIKPSGNKSLSFYTDLFTAIKNDPKAKRITYMQTWSNWGLDQFYVPYPAYDGNPEHEMYQDFLQFYNDPYSVFSAGVNGVYDNDANAEPAAPTVRIVSPADGVRVSEPATTVRVKATVTEPDRVYFTVEDDPAEYELTLGADGYYSAEWSIGEENLTNKSSTLNVFAVYDGQPTVQTGSSVILGEPTELPVGVVDDFETYSDDAALRSAYAYNNATAEDISLTGDIKGSGEYGVQFDYDFTARSYGGFGKVFQGGQDWSAFNQINVWLDPDGGNQKLVLQVNTANGQSFEAYPSLAGMEPTELAIDILDFRAKSDPNRSLAREDLTGVTEFWVYINQVGEPSASSIVLDDIRAVSGDAEPTLPTDPGTDPEEPAEPGVVDTFEGYADEAELRAAWSRAGAGNLTLSAEKKVAGEFGAGFPYSGGFTDFQKAINADWSAFDQLSFWVQPDGSEQKIVLQLVADGNYYDAVPMVTGSEATEVSIPFSEFTPAPFQGRDPALRPSPEELANVEQLVMFIESTGTSTGTTGVYYFDNIRASNKPVVDDDVDLRVSAKSQDVSGTVHVAVHAVNEEDVPVDIRLVTDFGSKKFSKVQPGEAVYNLFDTGSTQIPAGTATANGYKWVGGQGYYTSHVAAYEALTLVESEPEEPTYEAQKSDLKAKNRGGIDGLERRPMIRGQEATLTASGFAPGEWVWASVVTRGVDIGWVRADQSGAVELKFAVPDELRNGSNQVAMTGQNEGRILWERFVVKPERGKR
ncbi:hypothetical protein GCM10027403_23170 [Arthrobacter tecti]